LRGTKQSIGRRTRTALTYASLRRHGRINVRASRPLVWACDRPGKRGCDVGIWLELGVFVLVLLFGLWQIHDAKQAHAKTVAERKAREAIQAAPEARD
jgi:hypothetical protein